MGEEKKVFREQVILDKNTLYTLELNLEVRGHLPTCLPKSGVSQRPSRTASQNNQVFKENLLHTAKETKNDPVGNMGISRQQTNIFKN